MYLEIEENPNCEATPLQVFQTLSPARRVQQMKLHREGRQVLCWVTGIDKGGAFCPVYAQKVSDSGGGVSMLVYGGAWGIRFKPVDREQDPWDFSDSHQWGEPYKFYGDETDLIYDER